MPARVLCVFDVAHPVLTLISAAWGSWWKGCACLGLPLPHEKLRPGNKAITGYGKQCGTAEKLLLHKCWSCVSLFTTAMKIEGRHSSSYLLNYCDEFMHVLSTKLTTQMDFWPFTDTWRLTFKLVLPRIKCSSCMYLICLCQAGLGVPLSLLFGSVVFVHTGSLELNALVCHAPVSSEVPLKTRGRSRRGLIGVIRAPPLSKDNFCGVRTIEMINIFCLHFQLMLSRLNGHKIIY